MRPAPCCSNCSITPQKKPRWSQWVILILPATSRRSRITCVRFPTRASRNRPRSRRSSGRFQFAVIFRSQFRTLPCAAAASNARCTSPTEGLQMRKTNSQIVSALAIALATVITICLFLPACSVNVKKEQNGQDKQVDIDTPVGGIHVSKGASVADVGLAVYPGARLKQKDADGDDKSANVNISSFGFGLKVVALEYESDDSPAKLVAYYKNQLQKYGHVLECHTRHLDVNTNMDRHDHSPREVTCEGTSGRDIELKVGTDENQHIVDVQPDGSGSSFSLVYVRTHGKE